MQDADRILVCGDAAAVPLVPKSVHCIVTSPPYWSLRRYAGAQDRHWPGGAFVPMPGVPALEMPEWTGPLGLEPTPELFVWHSVLWARECWRVLRDDGVMWVVIGDSYAANAKGENRTPEQLAQHSTLGIPRDGTKPRKCTPANAQYSVAPRGKHTFDLDLQQGDLVGIPARLQLALQGDGWIVRNDVCWSKTNPMPESVRGPRWERCRVRVAKSSRAESNSYHAQAFGDRPQGARDGREFADHSNEYENCPGCDTCEPHGGYVLRRGSWRHTRAHETVLMCVKRMGYWSDQERVRENLSDQSIRALNSSTGWNQQGKSLDSMRNDSLSFRESPVAESINPAGRNPRSVLTVSSEAYPGAHYATYPTALIAPLILATCPMRCCPVCGAGWSPVVERTGTIKRRWSSNDSATQDDNWRRDNGRDEQTLTSVINYRPTCDCDVRHVYCTDDPYERCAVCDGPVQFTDVAKNGNCYLPGRVFDPFVGSGTTLQVARDLGLRGVGLDLAHSYLDQQAKVRASISAPSDALDNLPLFKDLE